jgi:hypothetical protein
MSAAAVTTYPYATTNAAGQFSVQSDGFIQGMAIADPVARYNLATGILSSNETLPMWGGVAICENIPLSTTDGSLGGTIARATLGTTVGTAGEITGFAVSDQAYAWITTPQSTAPAATTGMTVPFYRFKSNARIIVKCSAALINFDGSPISQQTSWDFAGSQLIPYIASYPQATPSAYNSYTSSTGILQLTFASAPGPLATNVINLSGFNDARLNGSWVVASTASAGTVLNIQVTTGLGSITPSAGVLNAGGGALTARVLQTQASGNKVIAYDSTLGTVNYTTTGNVAVLLLN